MIARITKIGMLVYALFFYYWWTLIGSDWQQSLQIDNIRINTNKAIAIELSITNNLYKVAMPNKYL